MTIGLGDVVNVLKLRIGGAIALSAVAGMAIAPGPAQPAWRILTLVLAVLLCSGAAGAFNQYFERDLDARMSRTRTRPFVSGKIKAGPWWLAAMAGLLVAGTALAAMLGWAAATYVFLGAAVYGLVYTVWLKRRTPWNIVVGGLAGSFAVLAGAAIVDPLPSPLPVSLAMILFLWTPPHFWSLALARRDDYAAAGVPMLPVILPPAAAARVILAHALVLVIVSFLPAMFGLGLVYLGCVILGGGLFVALCLRLAATPCRKFALGAFFGSLAQLLSVILGVLLEAL
ncbi:MAG: protoheme IX farnesyltransferase [Alphaproteobacteria bacterium]|nr:protoheme IX farnesyltransferase [Alphaproteobacteria bacterium]